VACVGWAGAIQTRTWVRRSVKSGEELWTAICKVAVVLVGREDVLHGKEILLGPERREEADAQYDVVDGWRRITRGKVADEDLPFPEEYSVLVQPEGYIAIPWQPHSSRGRLCATAVRFCRRTHTIAVNEVQGKMQGGVEGTAAGGYDWVHLHPEAMRSAEEMLGLAAEEECIAPKHGGRLTCRNGVLDCGAVSSSAGVSENDTEGWELCVRASMSCVFLCLCVCVAPRVCGFVCVCVCVRVRVR
jgi:hypothetical protein